MRNLRLVIAGIEGGQTLIRPLLSRVLHTMSCNATGFMLGQLAKAAGT